MPRKRVRIGTDQTRAPSVSITTASVGGGPPASVEAPSPPPLAGSRRDPASGPSELAAGSPQEARSTVWPRAQAPRSEEHTSELQSRQYLVCRLLLEKKKTTR